MSRKNGYYNVRHGDKPEKMLWTTTNSDNTKSISGFWSNERIQCLHDHDLTFIDERLIDGLPDVEQRNHDIINGFNVMADLSTDSAEANGWEIKNDTLNMCQKILLMHEELSEASRALREDNPMSKKIPKFSKLEEELADTMLRIGHFAKRLRLRIGEAMIAKVDHNKTRGHKHGNLKF